MIFHISHVDVFVYLNWFVNNLVKASNRGNLDTLSNMVFLAILNQNERNMISLKAEKSIINMNCGTFFYLYV